jgi:hypothetical protein
MAKLTTLEEKLAEVTGLAKAAQEATQKVEGLVDDEELQGRLRRMREEAEETERRCTQLAEERDGKKTAILEKARETKNEAAELVEWALPIQERHLMDVREGSLTLAAEEDPNA